MQGAMWAVHDATYREGECLRVEIDGTPNIGNSEHRRECAVVLAVERIDPGRPFRFSLSDRFGCLFL